MAGAGEAHLPGWLTETKQPFDHFVSVSNLLRLGEDDWKGTNGTPHTWQALGLEEGKRCTSPTLLLRLLWLLLLAMTTEVGYNIRKNPIKLPV